ncbi:MAG TPA: sodium-dependent bicarbonate transport family permease [Candidatus Binatia bacterium]|nr:sodium-dependent bicarbonate transport family permease [Candidatus Binatia bacterium]
MSELLLSNLLSPIVLAFVLGLAARSMGSDLRLPKDLYTSLSIYLLFALGLKGGVELSAAELSAIAAPALATVALGCITPVTAYFVLRRLGRFDRSDAAAIAAHYGSVSAVTFIAAQAFASSMGSPPEGFLPTLLALLESPGITIALALGIAGANRERPLVDTLHEIVTGRAMVLLVGGLVIGAVVGKEGWASVAPFFEGGFKGALTGERLGDLRKVGVFLAVFGVAMPIVHGALGAFLGSLAGLSIGGATVLAAMSASASYIAAPPAVRATLPDANPTFYLTASLAITFPFNVIVGIPLYYEMAVLLQR